MLSGFPVLEDFYVAHNPYLTGNVKSLRALKNTLREVTIAGCHDVEGDLMAFGDFGLLEKLCLINTKVRGDIREIQERHFPRLKKLDLPDGVYGGGSFDRIADAPEVMHAMFCLKKRIPTLFESRRWKLSNESPDRYETIVHHSREPPFWVEFFKADTRTGWNWTNTVRWRVLRSALA